MKDSSMRSALIGCLVFLPAAFGLTACGGWGGGSVSTLPDFPIDRDSARTLISGSPLNLSSEQITAEIEEITRTSDAILVSNLYVPGASKIIDSITILCADNACFSTDLNLQLDASDFAGADEYQAIAIRNGVSLFQARWFRDDMEESERAFGIEYGGWLDHSGFYVSTVFDAENRDDANSAAVYGISIGNASRTRPISGTWTGVMVGEDVSSTPTRGNVIHGDAGITVYFGSRNVDVSFTSVVDLNTGRSRDSMNWEVPLTMTGDFGSGIQHILLPGTPRIEGRFYGPNHEEVGGTFERDQIVGAFGAKRRD